MPLPSFKFVDLCCGIGAFHMALSKLGGKCVLACDKDKNCEQIYKANYGHKKFEWSDDMYHIRQLPPCDVVTCGYPCQSWSRAGRRMGTDDPRGKIIFQVLKLVREAKRRPSTVILENVRGILDVDRLIMHRHHLDYVAGALTAMGYAVRVFSINAAAFGAPVNRPRVYIVATKCPIQKELPIKPRRDQVIRDILQPSVKGSFKSPSKYVILPQKYWMTNENGNVFVGYLRAPTYRTRKLHLKSSHFQGQSIFHMRGKMETFTTSHRYHVYIPGRGVRDLTPREMYACMGFPSNFIISKHPYTAAGMISNSISMQALNPVCRWAMGNCLRSKARKAVKRPAAKK
jgi:DNA (cytosine-5)-methyltransferase 1